MKTLLTIFIVFQSALVLPAWAANWSPGRLCPLQKSFFLEQYAGRLNPKELATHIAAKAPHAILVGEHHGQQGNLYFPILLRRLKQTMPDLDCVTFEVTPSMYPNNFGGRPAWETLAAESAKLGMTNHKVDGCDMSAQKSPDMMCIDGRNKTMAANISGLIKNGICRRVLHVGGSFHLVNYVKGGAPNLTRRLRDGGLTTFTIHTAVSENERAALPRTAFAEDGSWRWGKFQSREPVCPEWAGVPSENFAFLNGRSKLAAVVPVFFRPDKKSKMVSWSAFDAALILGCPADEADRCDIAPIPGYLIP